MQKLPIIDAEFEDIPNSSIPHVKQHSKKPKQSRNHSLESTKISLVDNQILKGKKTKVETPKGRLDLLAKGIVQEQTGNTQLANLAGEIISLAVGKKVKGPEFQLLSKLMNGGF